MKEVNKEKAESLFGGGLCTTSPAYLLAYLFNSGFKNLRHTLGPHLQFFLVSLLAHRRHGLHIVLLFLIPCAIFYEMPEPQTSPMPFSGNHDGQRSLVLLN